MARAYHGLMRALLASLVALTYACASGSSNSSAGSSTDSRDYVGKDAQVDFATLKFVEAAERERFERARACLGERGAQWEHYPLRKIGNFVEEDWCRGEGAERGCSGGNFMERQGVDKAGVGTLHYPDQWPAVFGVQVNAAHRPAGEGWNVAVSVSTNGKKILGDAGSVSFEQPGKPDEAFYVGTSYGYAIAETSFRIDVEGDGWALLDRVRASPQALRDEALPHWDALQAKVVTALRSGKVLECVYGEYEGNGIPPACLEKVPLSPDAVTKEVAKIEAKVQAVHAAFEADAEGLHAALLGVAPVDCF